MYDRLLDMVSTLRGKKLFFPGCTAKHFAPELIEQYRNILQKIGVDFFELPDQACCGRPALDAGYEQDFYNMAKDNKRGMRTAGVGQIISMCPRCIRTFREEYNMKAYHVLDLVAQNLDKFEKDIFSEPITYFDDCEMAHALGDVETPRKILAYLGFELVEMPFCKDRSRCCGAGGGLPANNPGLAKKIARQRLVECKTGKLITSSTLCYVHMKSQTSDVQVMEMSEVLK